MGIIKSIADPDQGIESYSNTNLRQIHTANWRLLFELEENKLIVTLANFEMHCIHNITVEEFHNINRHRWETEKPYKFVHCTLSCEKCLGTGKLDWVENVRGKKGGSRRPHRGARFYYGRNPDHINIVNRKDIWDYEVKKFYASVPYLAKGQHLCECKGTGVYFMKTIPESLICCDN